MNSVERPLSPRETTAMTNASPVVAGWTYRGVVDRGLLDQAADALAAEYPALRARVVRHRAGWSILADQTRAAIGIPDASSDPLRAELNRPWAPEHCLARLVLAEHDGHGTLMIAVDHAFSDGRSVVNLLAKLWGHYSALVHGEPLAPVCGKGFGPPVEHLLAGRFTEAEIESSVAVAREIADQLSQLPGSALPTHAIAGHDTGSTPACVLGVRLDERETRAVIAAASTHRISVHALLTGILLAAVRSLLPDTADPALLLAQHAVDLRTRMEPPVQAGVLADYTSGAANLLPVQSEADPAALGQMVATQLNAALGSADLCLQPLVNGRMTAASALPATFMLSNLGAVETPRVPDGIELTGLRFLTSQSLDATPYLFAATACGRLSVDLVYRQTRHDGKQMAALRNEITAALRRIARQHRSPAQSRLCEPAVK